MYKYEYTYFLLNYINVSAVQSYANILKPKQYKMHMWGWIVLAKHFKMGR